MIRSILCLGALVCTFALPSLAHAQNPGELTQQDIDNGMTVIRDHAIPIYDRALIARSLAAHGHLPGVRLILPDIADLLEPAAIVARNDPDQLRNALKALGKVAPIHDDAQAAVRPLRKLAASRVVEFRLAAVLAAQLILSEDDLRAPVADQVFDALGPLTVEEPGHQINEALFVLLRAGKRLNQERYWPRIPETAVSSVAANPRFGGEFRSLAIEALGYQDVIDQSEIRLLDRMLKARSFDLNMPATMAVFRLGSRADACKEGLEEALRTETHDAKEFVLRAALIRIQGRDAATIDYLMNGARSRNKTILIATAGLSGCLGSAGLRVLEEVRRTNTLVENPIISSAVASSEGRIQEMLSRADRPRTVTTRPEHDEVADYQAEVGILADERLDNNRRIDAAWRIAAAIEAKIGDPEVGFAGLLSAIRNDDDVMLVRSAATDAYLFATNAVRQKGRYKQLPQVFLLEHVDHARYRYLAVFALGAASPSEPVISRLIRVLVEEDDPSSLDAAVWAVFFLSNSPGFDRELHRDALATALEQLANRSTGLGRLPAELRSALLLCAEVTLQKVNGDTQQMQRILRAALRDDSPATRSNGLEMIDGLGAAGAFAQADLEHLVNTELVPRLRERARSVLGALLAQAN